MAQRPAPEKETEELARGKAAEGAPRSELRVIVSREAGVSVLALPPRGRFTIGRGAECEVVLDDASVSRHHAVLFAERTLVVEDTKSRNGTFVGGRRLAAGERVELRPGTVVEVGSVTLLVDEARGVGERREPMPAASPRVVVEDPALRRLYAMIEVIGPSPLSVLLLGETGVGKEVFAEEVHRRSDRASGPFVRVNSAAMAEALLDSELFGHERGAFTGATTTREGLFEQAHKGTLFLDEIGEMALATQAKLLRVLETGEVRRVGGADTRVVDVRVLSATNRDLRAEAEAGRFRADLYFRLNGVSITIPPLRDRPLDLEPLALHFARRVAAKSGKPEPRFGPEALAVLRAHAWPGNARELRNVIERAVILSSGPDVTLDASAILGLGAATPKPAQKEASTPHASSLKTDLRDVERGRILEALAKTNGNQTEAAALLGLSRRTLTNRLNALELPRPRKK